MRNSTVCAAIIALLLSAGSASAHHPFAKDFDKNKPVTLSGTVTKTQWTAPHVYAYIDVKDEQGKTANWKVEMGNPTALTKAGWTKTKLKVGEMVTLQGWQAKNGTNFANAEEMTLPDGQKLSAASSNGSAVATSGRGTPKPATDKPSTKPSTDKPSTSAPKY